MASAQPFSNALGPLGFLHGTLRFELTDDSTAPPPNLAFPAPPLRLPLVHIHPLTNMGAQGGWRCNCPAHSGGGFGFGQDTSFQVREREGHLLPGERERGTGHLLPGVRERGTPPSR